MEMPLAHAESRDTRTNLCRLSATSTSTPTSTTIFLLIRIL